MPAATAAGRKLREPLRARVDIPVFDNSAMDGFAVRFADVAAAGPDSPVTLQVVGDLPAGSPLDPPLAPGEAIRIMTGSAVPTGADGIVPFEDTAGGLDDSLGRITVVRAPARAGMHIRRRGEDLVAGDELLPAGVELGAFQLSAAASPASSSLLDSGICPRTSGCPGGTSSLPVETTATRGRRLTRSSGMPASAAALSWKAPS